MILALIIVASVMTYAMIAGWTVGRARAAHSRKRPHCEHRACDGYFCAAWVGVLWPILLPATSAMSLSEEGRSDRVAVKRAAEKEEAEHRIDLAMLARREAEELAARERALRGES